MVSATGIGSGLDIEGLVTQLVSAERAPTAGRLLRREASLTSEISAFGTLKGALAAFQTQVSALNSLSTFNQRTANTSDADTVTASASQSAATGSYDIEVDQLAKAQSLASGSFASVTETVGEGTLTFRFGTTDYTPADPGPESYNGFTVNADRAIAAVTIDSSNNSLQGVRDAINDADIGVSAAIVNDGSNYRLLLSSDQSGADNSIEIQADDTGDGDDINNSGLSQLAFNASANNISQTVAAQDALFSINGLSLTSDSNTIADTLDDVSLTLKNTTSGSPTTVSVADNSGSVKQAINAFVDAYNSFVTTANNLTSYDPETGVAGPLQGDFSARSITNSVRSSLSSSAQGFNGPFSTLAELGITTKADGTLSINSSTLDQALQNNFDSVAGVFAQAGTISDANLRFDGASDDTQIGNYSVNITQLATQGELTGTAITAPSIGSPLTIDSDNNNLSLIIDGISSATIALTEGDYTSGDSLAAELQARINGDSSLSDAGISVAVSFTASNELQISSVRYGAQSSVEINSIDTNTTADLGLSAVAGTGGVNVAGTIGGFAATGNGQLLSGAVGSNTDGIRLTITGGSTGSRGFVEISRGIAYQLNNLLDGFLESGGLLSARTDGLQDRIDDISDDRETLDLRMAALEARYRAQFNALDTLLAQIQDTGSFITQQLANIPLPGSLDN